MALKVTEINEVSPETQAAIARRSAQSLPNNPSERGYSADEIKKRFYQPILDTAHSALAEINRVVRETNASISEIVDELDNFIDSTKITESYKVELDSSSWSLNEETGLYEFIITKDDHKIEACKDIGVDMFLLDASGKYIQVNQFDIKADGTIRCFHEISSIGHVSVYMKREGLVLANVVVDADHIVNLAKVGKSNNYEDLDNKPNLGVMGENSLLLSKIIQGGQEVQKAKEAEKAKSADTAALSMGANIAESARTAARATCDAEGNEISLTYAKKSSNGTVYKDMKVGAAEMADEAYKAKTLSSDSTVQGQKVSDIFVEGSPKVKKSAFADEAEKSKSATKDGSGNTIDETYMKVSELETKVASEVSKGLSSFKNEADSKFTTGRVVDYEEVKVTMRAGWNANGSDSCGFFRTTTTPFHINALTSKKIVEYDSNGNATTTDDKKIIYAAETRVLDVDRERRNVDYIFLKLEGFELDNYPKVIRVTNKSHEYGVEPNAAVRTGTTTINGENYAIYEAFCTVQDFDNGHKVLIELLP